MIKINEEVLAKTWNNTQAIIAKLIIIIITVGLNLILYSIVMIPPLTVSVTSYAFYLKLYFLHKLWFLQNHISVPSTDFDSPWVNVLPTDLESSQTQDLFLHDLQCVLPTDLDYLRTFNVSYQLTPILRESLAWLTHRPCSQLF